MPMLAGVEEVAPIIVHDRVRKDEWLAPNLRNDGPIARTSSSADRGGKSGAGVRQSLDDLMKESLATVLTRIGLFSNMDSMLKEELLDSFFLYEPAGGEVVVSTGEPQSLFYVIYRGSCGVYDIPAEFVHQAFSNVTSGAGGEVSAPSVSVSSPVKARSRAAIRKESSEGGNQDSFDDLDKAKSGDVALKRESSRKAFMEGEFSYKALSESPGISPRERRGNKSPNNSFRKVQGMGESKKWIQGMGESKKWNAEDSMSRTNMRSAEFNRELSDLSQGAMSPVESARARMIQGQGLDINSSLGSILRPGGGLKKEKDKSKKKMEFQVVSMLYGGDTFNEMSLVFDSVSKVTIRAMQRDVQLLAVDSQIFRRKQMAYEQQRRKEISQALLKTPWGRFLPTETFNNLVDACELVKYETGNRIVSEWDEDANNYFYQIVSGSAMEVVEKKSAADRLQSRMDWTSSRPTRSRRFSSIQVDFEKVLQEYFKGDYFCEFVLHTVSVEMDINKVHLNPTVVCEQPCICLRLARNVFRSIVGSMETLMEANTKKIEGQISPERFERRPSTFSRRPSAVGIERRPSAVGIERRPSAVGIERRPSAVGIERRPSAVGIEHRRSSSVERRSSSVERRSSSVERKSSIVKAQSTDSKVGSGSASPHQRRPPASPLPGHSSTDGGHSPLNRQGQSGTDDNLGTQLGQPTPLKHDQNDSSNQVSAIDLSSAASSMSPSNIPAGQARNTIIIEPLAPVSERMEVSQQNRADLDPVRSQNGVGQVEFSSQDGDQENDVKADQQPQADECIHGSDDGAVLAPDTTLSASTTELGRTDDENRGSQDQDESFVGVQGKNTSGATVSREAHSGGNASKGSNNELVSQQVVSESQPIFYSREKVEKAPKFYDNMAPVTSDEVTRMATDQEDMVAAVIRNMLSDVVSNIAGKTIEGSADAERDIVSVLIEPATQETLILVDKYDQAKQDGLSHFIDTGTQDRSSPDEEKEFECYESKAGDEVGDTEAKDPVDSASALDQFEITHVVDGMEMDVVKLQTAVAIPSLEQHQVKNIVIGPEIFSKGKAEASEDVPVAEGANAHSVEGSDSADNMNAAGQSEVLVLDDDDVGTPQTEDDTVNSEFGSPPVVRRRKSSLTGSVGLPPRSPGMIGMTTLDSVAESLLHVAAGKVGEIGDGFARRSSGGAMWQGSRPGTQGGRPKSQGFGSRPMTQGSSSGPSRTPSRPGTHGPPGLDTWGMHFDPDQSRPNTVRMRA
jgi:CRP-like cAMP-binding protein